MSVILCDIADANDIIEEERLNWAFGILEYLGIPEEVINSNSIDDYREKMDFYGIEVELSSVGEVRIYKKEWHEGQTDEQSGWLNYTEDHIIGHWKEPTRVIKIDSNNRAYYEIHLNEWSVLNMRQKA
jgi:hypothetical protein